MKTAMERMINFLILNPNASLDERLTEAERLRDKDEKTQIIEAWRAGKRNEDAKGEFYYAYTFEKEI